MQRTPLINGPLLLLSCRWVPYIRALNNHILDRRFRVPHETQVLRKSFLTHADAARFAVGASYRTANYAATSTLRDPNHAALANVGRLPLEVLWRITVPANCLNACDCSRVAVFAAEAEVLLVPYTAFEVTDITRVGNLTTIWARVYQDNLTAPEDLPTRAA